MSGMELDDVPREGRGQQRKPSDSVQTLQFKAKKWMRLRFTGQLSAYAGHWIKFRNKEGKDVKYYKNCPAWDPETNSRKGDDGTYGMQHCAWCRHAQYEHVMEVPKEKRLSRWAKEYWANVISRAVQEAGPPDDAAEPTKQELKTGFKDIDSDSWTPYRALRLTPSLLEKIQDLRGLNNHEDEESGKSGAYPVTHSKYGCDVLIMADPDTKTPANYYSVNIGNGGYKLTRTELGYLKWDISDLVDYPSEKEMEEDYRSVMKRIGMTPVPTDWDGEPIDLNKGKKKKASEDDDGDGDDMPKKTSKRKASEDDDDDTPPPKKKPSKFSDDDDDDDLPPKKKKPPVDEEDDDPPPPKKKPKKVDEEDDDDPPPKKKKPPVDEEDDDDAPPPKKKKPPVDDDDDPPPPKKKKPPVDEEEEEDDDPPPKKKKKPVDDEDDDVPPPKKKKPPVDDDDDDPPPKKKKKPVDDEDDGLD